MKGEAKGGGKIAAFFARATKRDFEKCRGAGRRESAFLKTRELKNPIFKNVTSKNQVLKNELLTLAKRKKY